MWDDLVAHPLGAAIERRFTDDTVRGVVGTDALIGTFASLHDPSLVQNRCFLYHLIGNGTGEWRVPVGGMGAVTAALAAAARPPAPRSSPRAGVSAIQGDDDRAEVTWHDGTASHTVTGRHVLANVAPWVLRILMGEDEDPDSKPVGAQLKINFLLDRLPALKSGIDPAVAFAGTLHLAEDYSQLETAYDEAAAGQVPSAMPGRGLLPLADRPLDPRLGARRDAHADLLRAAHPGRAVRPRPEEAKRLAVARALASLNQHLVDPIETCVATDANGQPCIEAKIPQDIEADLAMPGGHIFHGDLDWPWAANRARLETPAQQWGVQTDVALGHGLRLGLPPGRGGLRHRRAQRRPGRPRLPLTRLRWLSSKRQRSSSEPWAPSSGRGGPGTLAPGRAPARPRCLDFSHRSPAGSLAVASSARH